MWRSVATNSGWWIAERMMLLALTFVTSIVLVRMLGPAGFGELSYLLAIVGLLVPVTQVGVNGLVARAVLEAPGDERQALGTALALRLGGSLAALVIGAGYWALAESGQSGQSGRWVLLVLLVAQPAMLFQVLEFWFQAHLRAGALVPWRAGVLALSALLKIALAALTRDVQAVALVFAAEYLLMGGAYLVAYRRTSGRWIGPVPTPAWLRWFGARAPWLFGSGLAEIIYLRIDIVMLERLRGVEETGVYAVAARLSEIWYALPVMIAASLFPALWARRGNPAAYARGLQAALDTLAGMAIALAVVVQVVAAPLVTLLFGASYAAAAPVLSLHIWAGVFVFMRAVLSRWLLAEDLMRLSLLTHAGGAVINVGANLLLIPRFGAMGAAWATVIAYAAAGWGMLFLSARTRPFAGMMAKALLLPLRWGSLARYLRRLRTA